MPQLEIACPTCGQRLKVPDRSLLGRKARCGKCRETFVMQESSLQVDGPRRATAPKEVSAVPQQVAELADLKPGVARPTDRAGTSRKEWSRSKRADSVPSTVASGESSFPELVEETPVAGIDLLPVGDADEEFLSLRAQRRSKSNRKRTIVAAGVVAILLIGGATMFLVARSSKTSTARVAATATTENPAARVDEVKRNLPETITGPTSGKPFSLRHVPMGARIVMHVRPGVVWGAGPAAAEFRACLGPLGAWADEKLNSICLVEPAAIDRVLFALIPTSREAFDVAAVVTTQHEMKRSELLEKINGELIDQPKPHYVNAQHAYLLPDARTVVVVPRELAGSMLESNTGAGVASQGIEGLLPLTDRDRHFTLLAELEDVRNGVATLASESARPLLGAIIDFFGDDAETIAASLHLGDAGRNRDLFTQVLVRNRETRTPRHLKDELQSRFAALPAAILDIARRTNPQQIGEKKLVGRFPIMTKVVEQSSVIEAHRRYVSLDCQLPERAGPNLALAAILTWQQTVQSNYGQSPGAPEETASRPARPATIAERLRKKIDVEFRDDFLYVAVEYIGNEIGVSFKLDGAGMKRAGITQNEKQKFKFDQQPAIVVLDHILTPRKLVLIVDEQRKTATITGAEEAEDRKLVPFPLKASRGE